jgi:hypothetical protein
MWRFIFCDKTTTRRGRRVIVKCDMQRRAFSTRQWQPWMASADRPPAEKDSPFGALATNISEAELAVRYSVLYDGVAVGGGCKRRDAHGSTCTNVGSAVRRVIVSDGLTHPTRALGWRSRCPDSGNQDVNFHRSLRQSAAA